MYKVNDPMVTLDSNIRREEISDQREKKRKNPFLFIRNVIILVTAAFITLLLINKTGTYPWGSDTYGHLFKGNILYEAFKQGKWFLNYHESWYNGIQPFRYWAPLPYYILALMNLITNNIFITYHFFVFMVFVVGGMGWLLWGWYFNRQNLGLVIAILWFFVPDNLRVLFSEGNIPFVLVNMLIPFVFLYYYRSKLEDKISNYLILSVLMSIITLSHGMLSAMIGLSLLILAILDGIINKSYRKNLLCLIYAFFGILLSSFWLYPALKGGIMGLNKDAVARVMEGLTYPLRISLNPLLRFESIETYYFGIAFAIAGAFGLLMSNKVERVPFLSALIILLGTTKMALPLLQNLPMNQLFWMRRFTSISMAMILAAVFLWKKLRKRLLVFMIFLFIIDSGLSFYILGFNREFPSNLSEIFNTASKVSTQRIGVLDNSSFGSFPSYAIAYNDVNGGKNQIYGWAWQGAATGSNIVALNTSLENEYYPFMFDRALELGADTLVIRKSFITDYEDLESAAHSVGYRKYDDYEEAVIYKYPILNEFGIKTEYRGIAIGSYASNISFLFPEFTVGDREFLDDYTFDELKKNKVIYLSGFKFRNKKVAEDLLLELSQMGVRVVIDVTGFDRESFLGVTAEPITVKNNYQDIYYKGIRLQMKEFPDEYKEWRTYFLGGLNNEENYGIIDYKVINYVGQKYNDHLTFIGFNLPYYAFLTKDPNAIHILEEVFDLSLYGLPKREVYPIDVDIKEDEIIITSDRSDIIVPLAALDGFQRESGDYDVVHHLVHLKTPQLKIKIIYPYFYTGAILSIMSFGVIAALSWIILKNRKLFLKETS